MRPSRKISFNFDIEKFVNVIAYFASKVEGLDKLKTVKLLYLADRHHLIKYARPIIGGRYCKLPYGPISSRALDEINNAIESPNFASNLFRQYIEVDRKPKHPILRAKKPADLEVFSESELEILGFIIDEYGKKHGTELIRIVHNHAAYIKSRGVEDIDYRLFFEEEPDAKNILELVELEQENRDLVKKLRD